MATVHSAGVASRSPALAEYDTAHRPGSAFSASAGILTNTCSSYSSNVVKSVRAAVKATADDIEAADEEWSLSGWEDAPSVPEAARVASAKLSKHKSAALSDAAPAISNTSSRNNSRMASAKVPTSASNSKLAASTASKLRAAGAALGGALTSSRSPTRRGTTGTLPTAAAAALAPCVIAFSAKTPSSSSSSKVRHAVEKQRQRRLLEVGEESEGDAGAEQHYRPVLAGQAELDAVQAVQSQAVQLEAIQELAGQLVSLEVDRQQQILHSGFASSRQSSSAVASCSGGEAGAAAAAATAEEQQDPQQQQQQQYATGCCGPGFTHHSLVLNSSPAPAAVTPASKALRPTLSFSSASVGPTVQCLAGLQQLRQSASAGSAVEGFLRSAVAANDVGASIVPGGCSHSAWQQQQVLPAVAAGGAAQAVASASSALSQLLLLPHGAPAHGTLHLGSTFKRSQSFTASAAAAAGGGTADVSQGPRGFLLQSNANAEPFAALTHCHGSCDMQKASAAAEQLAQHAPQQQQQQQPLLRVVSFGRPVGNSSSSTGSSSGMIGSSGSMLLCQQQVGGASHSSRYGSGATEQQAAMCSAAFTHSKCTVADVSATAASSSMGGISCSMAALQQKLLPGRAAAAAAAPLHSTTSNGFITYHSATGAAACGGAVAAVASGTVANSSSSIGPGLQYSLPHSRVATTGLAARAQMLLTKDLTTITPRAPRVRDPLQQQPQQQQQHPRQQLAARPGGVSRLAAAPASEVHAGPAQAAGSSSSSMIRPISGDQRGSKMGTLAYAAGAGPAASQLQSQGLAAAAEYQKARAAVDDILLKIASSRDSSSSSSSNSVPATAAAAVGDAAGDAEGAAEAGLPLGPPALGRCRSLKAYEEFQAAAVSLPTSTPNAASSSSCTSSTSSSKNAAKPAGLAVGSTVSSPRVTSAAAAAAAAAQRSGLQLVGSPASRRSTGC